MYMRIAIDAALMAMVWALAVALWIIAVVIGCMAWKYIKEEVL